MSKKQDEVRYIFAKDLTQCVLGFKTAEEARLHAVNKFEVMDTEERRIRVRYRSRTNTFDVVVKTRQAVKKTEQTEKAA